MLDSLVYKIVPEALWREAAMAGQFDGSPVDQADGFIHLSSAEQLAATAARHFAGQSSLLLVALDPQNERVAAALKWEASRGGALFPHLYASLACADALWVRPLPVDTDGRHDFSGVSGATT